MVETKSRLEKVPKILIVDDQEENLFAMEAMLNDLDARIFKARSGMEALSLLLHHNFAILFLDVKMPEMDGFELAKLIRGNNKTKNIPIIFLSAYGKEDHFVSKGYETGAVDYILKPFNTYIVKQKAKVFLELYNQKTLLEQATNELSITNKKLSKAKDELEIRIKERTQELVIANEKLNQEILKYQQAEKYQKLTAQILEMLNQPGKSKNIIKTILSYIHISTGFEAVAIRLQKGEDFPYFESRGFSESFIETGKYLCKPDDNGEVIRDSNGKAVLERICGNILKGNMDKSQPFYTEGGSFWTNSTTKFLQTITEMDRSNPNNLCNVEGYESVAFIPLHVENKIVGLLQLNDHRKNMFTLEIVEYFEGIGASIGIALDRIQTEKEIRTLNQNLEERVVERTSQLKSLNDELETFTYSISHDLRSPLRGIDGFSQVLINEYQDKLDAQGKRYLQRIRVAAQHMAILLDDILSLLHINRAKIKIRPVNLTNIAKEIASSFKSINPGREVEFIIEEGIIANGDRRLLKYLLEQFLDNAWKFTSKQVKARIEFGKQNIQNETVYFVRDNGIGFDMKYAHLLFGAFQRLHDSKEFRGTGIGLAIVQRIVRKHKGKVWVEGEVGKGAVFYFTI